MDKPIDKKGTDLEMFVLMTLTNAPNKKPFSSALDGYTFTVFGWQFWETILRWCLVWFLEMVLRVMIEERNESNN